MNLSMPFLISVLVILGVMKTSTSVRSSFSARCLNSQPSTGMSPKNGTLVYERPV